MLRGQSIFPIPAAYSSQYQSYILAQSAVAVSAPADTSEDTLATITVPANAMGANGLIRLTTNWSCTNNANIKTARVRYSGGAGTVLAGPPLTSQDSMQGIIILMNRGATNSQYSAAIHSYYPGAGGTGSLNGFRITAAIDSSVLSTLVITGQKTVGGDTLTLDAYLAEVLYGA